MSVLKIKNGSTWEEIPAGGVGVPSGGNAGDVLVKSNASDYATEWADISIPSSSGTVGTYPVFYYKKWGNVVQVWATSAGHQTINTTEKLLVTLPEGYRPSSLIQFPGFYNGTSNYTCRFSIDTDGSLKGFAPTGMSYWSFNTTFIVD